MTIADLIKVWIAGILLLCVNSCSIEEKVIIDPYLDKIFKEEWENAATYYRKAFELMKTEGLSDPDVDRIFKEGWKDSEEAKKFLESNKPALEEFKKAIKTKNCKFVEGELKAETPLPHVVHASNLSKIAILQAIYHESSGQYAEMFDMLNGVIKMADDLTNGKILVEALIASVIKADAFNVMRRTFSQRIPSEILKNEIHFLENRQIPKFGEILENDRALIGSALRGEIDLGEMLPGGEIDVFALIFGKEPWCQILVEEELMEEVRKRYKEKVATIIEKIKQNDLVSLVKCIEEPVQKIREKFRNLPTCEVLKDPDKLREIEEIAKDPNVVADLWGGYLWGMLPSTVKLYVFAEVRLQLLRVAFAVRLYQMEKGKLPEREDLKSFPTDIDGKEIRYKKQENKVTIWSIGPNLKDDGGIPPEKENILEHIREGDIVIDIPRLP